jgi:hypothetical protein
LGIVFGGHVADAAVPNLPILVLPITSGIEVKYGTNIEKMFLRLRVRGAQFIF